MKPKTKIQKRVHQLSKILAPINERQKQWGYDHCLEKIGLQFKRETVCLECSHKWTDKQPPLLTALDGVVCPNCNKRLKIDNTTRKRKFKEHEYFCIITKCREFQVLRYLGKVAEYECTEVVQRWISPKGENVIRAILRQTMGTMYYDSWILHSKMEIRGNEVLAYKPDPIGTYPIKKYIPELKRNGFKGTCHGIKPYKFIPQLLSNSKAETLLKAQQYGLLRRCISEPDAINKHWNQIKIAIRNNYYIPANDVSQLSLFICFFIV
jgi:DNA-directed RNA polymerase subunit RPC12/RpoP